MSNALKQLVRPKCRKSRSVSILKEIQCRGAATVSADTNTGDNYDVAIVGGGIVGCASAREIKNRKPHLKIAILEKENRLAQHQTGHNSGVIHAGIYYKPGSMKAKLCGEGMRLLYQFCDERKIPYKKCGKLIVASDKREVELLADLYDRGLKNDVPELKLLKSREEIKTVEPHCEGLQALWSPHTGIVDYGLVCEEYAKEFQENGGKVFKDYEVTKFQESSNPNYPVTLSSRNGEKVQSKYVLTCGGLQSDKLAELSGCSRDPKIVPFRGEYLVLNPKKNHLIKGNIYPVPDPRFPFLGVHFTPRMDGSIWLGPNAVLAFKREGYRWCDINIKELVDSLSYPGLIKLISKYPQAGIQEISRSLVTSLQVKQLQRYIPSISAADVRPGPSGVRAQAMDIEGNLVEDFYFDKGDSALGKRILHCRNAPSPGATSSLAIAKMMADRVEKEFGLK